MLEIRDFFLIDFSSQSFIPFYIVTYLCTCANARILLAKGLLQHMPVHVFKLNCHLIGKSMATKEITDNEQYFDNLEFVYLFSGKSVPV